MYRVVLKKSAEKDLARLDSRFRGRIIMSLVALRGDPYLGKPLLGELKGFFSLRVWPYRIIYTIVKNQLVVYVIAISHRQGAY